MGAFVRSQPMSRRLILPFLASLSVVVLVCLHLGASRTAVVLLEKEVAKPGDKDSTSSTYHGIKTSKSREDLDSYFEAIPVYRVNAYHEMGKGEKETASTVTARDSQQELNDYFNKIPTDDVDAYHEAKAKWHGKKFETAESRKALKQYFNSKGAKLHSNFHRVSASDAVQDLVSYYDSIPTSKVNAFHESQMLIPTNSAVKKEEGSKQAFKDLSDYFDKIPTHAVNAFHEKSAHAHQPMPAHDYDANKAFSDLSDYFSAVPTHHVNAYHESAAALAAEGVEKKKRELKQQTLQQDRIKEDKAARVQAAVHKALTDAVEDEGSEHGKAARVQQAVHAAVRAQDEERNGGEQLQDEAKAEEEGEGRVTVSTEHARKWDEELNKEMTVGLGLKGDGKEEEGGGGAGKSVRAHDVANLNDDAGPDPDAPTGTEVGRHAEGYDTQYGLTARLAGDVTIEKTPSGPVLSRLTTERKKAEAEATARAALKAKEEEEAAAKEKAWRRRVAEYEAARRAHLLAIREAHAAQATAARRTAMAKHAQHRAATASTDNLKPEVVIPRAAHAEEDWSKLAVPVVARKAAGPANKAASHGDEMKVAGGQKMAAVKSGGSLAERFGKAACELAGLACSW